MLIRRASLVLAATLIAPALHASAQQSPVSDSARAGIHASLRSFYFNLAHQDWEALTAEILPAKIVAHRPAPEAFVRAAASLGPSGSHSSAAPMTCSTAAIALVEQAAITLDGDWAEVTVPRCTVASAGADKFRLIRFQERWRVVYIDLFQEPVNVSAERSP
jgi:hypothetical protein